MNSVQKYIKPSEPIEAIQWDGTVAGWLLIQKWAPEIKTITDVDGTLWLIIYMETSATSARANDWVIRDATGNFSFCRCDIFNTTYKVEEEVTADGR